MTWFRPQGREEGDDAPLLQRRRRVWEAVQPLPPGDATCWPGTWPAPEPAIPDPAALPVARFVGRRAKLAEGVTWLEGRIEALGDGQQGRRRRVGRLVLEGEAPDLLRLAAELARTLPLLPAGASLAEEALALAEGRA
ncbi:MAG: hypothetical protein JWR00_763, partial [Rubritepida sp.]|nr:hypothetical protein [Rubritepida sp.]